MEITKVKRTEMYKIDLSDIIYYSAVVDGMLLQTHTDGIFYPHITKDEFIRRIKNRYYDTTNL